MEDDINNEDDSVTLEDKKQKHLTPQDRRDIETCATAGMTKTKIAEKTGKTKSCIGKELSEHRYPEYKCAHTDCTDYKGCKIRELHPEWCTPNCKSFNPFHCPRRDWSPGVCNGCGHYHSCRHNKYVYSASVAQEEYEKTLSECRKGATLLPELRQSDAEILSDSLSRGISLDKTVQDNLKKLHRSTRTYYRYIHNGDFYGCSPNIDLLMLRFAPGRKPTAPDTKPSRIPPEYIRKRDYNKFTEYIAKHPRVSVVEMDTVMNNPSGPYIQTFFIKKFNLLIGFLTPSKSADAMVDGMNKLQELLGPKLFKKYVQVVLTDQGSEFAHVYDLEHDENGNQRTLVFFCNGGHPWEKARIEKRHSVLRFIIPKKKSFASIGLTSQEKLNLAMSNVDSYSSANPDKKSPLEIIKSIDPELYEALDRFGIRFIDSLSLILDESLLKDKKK